MRHVQAEPIQRSRGAQLRPALRQGLIHVRNIETEPSQSLGKLLDADSVLAVTRYDVLARDGISLGSLL